MRFVIMAEVINKPEAREAQKTGSTATECPLSKQEKIHHSLNTCRHTQRVAEIDYTEKVSFWSSLS